MQVLVVLFALSITHFQIWLNTVFPRLDPEHENALSWINSVFSVSRWKGGSTVSSDLIRHLQVLQLCHFSLYMYEVLQVKMTVFQHHLVHWISAKGIQVSLLKSTSISSSGNLAALNALKGNVPSYAQRNPVHVLSCLSWDEWHQQLIK